MTMLLNLLISIALVFTALGLVCAVTIGWRRAAPADPYAWPFGDVPVPAPRSRAEVVRIARAETRFTAGGLRRDVLDPPEVRLAAGVADGGHSVPTEVPAIRVFRMIRGGRDV